MTSIYEEYGIPTEVGESMMKIISYIAIESPKVASEASYVNPELVDLVDHFDIIWTTSMEKSYAKRRKWDKSMAIREFVQNALDAEHENLGYDNIDLKMYSSKKMNSLIIEDHGPGITYKAFALGGEDKKCYLRGAYGEGMKVAALYMYVNGNDTYIFSGDIVYKCYISKITNMLTISIGKATQPFNGTKVVIHNLQIGKNTLDPLIYHPDSPTIKKKSTSYYATSGCEYDMPNTVIQSEEGVPNKLYVRDMYVNDMDNITQPSFYGYNLWWVDLEPNRKNVSRLYQLTIKVSYILSISDPYFITELIKRNMVYIQKPPHYIINSELFEIDHCKFINVRKDTLDEIRKLCTNKLIGAYTTSHDNRDVLEANHEGITPIVIPTNFATMFSMINLPKVSDILIKTHKKLAEVDQIPLDQLYVSQLSTYNEWNKLAVGAMGQTSPGGISMVVNSGDRSFYTPLTNTISMSINRVENEEHTSFIHELSHAIDYARNHTTNDMTEHFESALAGAGSILLHLASMPEVSAFMSRCNDFCFNASVTYIEDFFDTEFVYTSGILNELFKCPTCIYVSMYIENGVERFPISRVSSNIDPEWLPREAERIYNTDTDRATTLIIDLMHRVMTDVNAYTSIMANDELFGVTELIGKTNGDACYEQLSNMLRHVQRDKVEGNKVGIYKYDIIRDKYIYAKEWTT